MNKDEKPAEDNRAKKRMLKSRIKANDAFGRKMTLHFRKQIVANDKKAALKKRIEKSKAASLQRNEFRKKIAKEKGVNWKRVQIVDWKKLTYMIK